MAVPSDVVHHMEGHASGFDGPYPRSSKCTGGGKEGQLGDVVSAVDSYTPGAYRVTDVTAFRHLERRAAVQ